MLGSYWLQSGSIYGGTLEAFPQLSVAAAPGAERRLQICFPHTVFLSCEHRHPSGEMSVNLLFVIRLSHALRIVAVSQPVIR